MRMKKTTSFLRLCSVTLLIGPYFANERRGVCVCGLLFLAVAKGKPRTL